jgi:hypothetical protein
VKIARALWLALPSATALAAPPDAATLDFLAEWPGDPNRGDPAPDDPLLRLIPPPLTPSDTGVHHEPKPIRSTRR